MLEGRPDTHRKSDAARGRVRKIVYGAGRDRGRRVNLAGSEEGRGVGSGRVGITYTTTPKIWHATHAGIRVKRM